MVELDKDGFLQDPKKWTKEIAIYLAEQDNITLTEKHWEIILFIREYYDDFDSIPPVQKICARTGLRVIDLFDLFPRGPINGACRIAGLPSKARFD